MKSLGILFAESRFIQQWHPSIRFLSLSSMLTVQIKTRSKFDASKHVAFPCFMQTLIAFHLVNLSAFNIPILCQVISIQALRTCRVFNCSLFPVNIRPWVSDTLIMNRDWNTNTPGYIWTYLETSGYIWTHLGTSGYIWTHMDTPWHIQCTTSEF